jgi:hypothetical protein
MEVFAHVCVGVRVLLWVLAQGLSLTGIHLFGSPLLSPTMSLSPPVPPPGDDSIQRCQLQAKTTGSRCKNEAQYLLSDPVCCRTHIPDATAAVLFTLQELEADGGSGSRAFEGSGALSLIGLDTYRALFGDLP